MASDDLRRPVIDELLYIYRLVDAQELHLRRFSPCLDTSQQPVTPGPYFARPVRFSQAQTGPGGPLFTPVHIFRDS